ncbi:hypothetical protein CEUSTIGMA_g2868.t1 [Chlamydomonas eustigma]|uniref:Erythromycin biosynthesis protein CIII-like C-terminal domain-containing protein n=1 Tax=Chlamydomonas eustigma TaxID=1157962 RepID=A0A250WX67_9CHLO|nr:hypothetical protein CEUSTIGMA_g2868.t1 [Chlamydomonas eustigma]|eukprot:GAX75424.1 hypothetical protein CEUSTIGMA_g2868.t1 [Chlamydomonas eustigma]
MRDKEDIPLSSSKKAVVFIAFGTRGDVQPLATLAEHICSNAHDSDWEAQLLTHRAHSNWLNVQPYHNLKCFYLETPPVGSVQHAQRNTSSCHGSLVMQQGVLQKEQQMLWDQIRDITNLSVVVFNLFALEGYHIAEALNVRCVAASPYQMPYACPAHFKRSFIMAHGLPLFNRLVEAEGTGQVSWKEVTLWMWPLFTERWAKFRTEILSLAPCPLYDRNSHLPLTDLPPAITLLYGFSFSEKIFPQPGYYPASVITTGFWYPPNSWYSSPLPSLPDSVIGLMSISSCECGEVDHKGQRADVHGTHGIPDVVLQQLDISGGADVEDSLSGNGDVQNMCGLVCVDLASSGPLGHIKDPTHLLTVLAAAFEALSRKALVLTSGWRPIHEAFQQLPPHLQDRLLLHPNPIPHQLLLPSCGILMHPGGSGTIAAALLAGCPQLLFPYHHDQPMWAERLHHLGLSPPPLDSSMLLGGLLGEDRRGMMSDPSVLSRNHSQPHEHQSLEIKAASCSNAGTIDAAVLEVLKSLKMALSASQQAACKLLSQELQVEPNGIDVASPHILMPQ